MQINTAAPHVSDTNLDLSSMAEAKPSANTEASNAFSFTQAAQNSQALSTINNQQTLSLLGNLLASLKSLMAPNTDSPQEAAQEEYMVDSSLEFSNMTLRAPRQPSTPKGNLTISPFVNNGETRDGERRKDLHRSTDRTENPASGYELTGNSSNYTETFTVQEGERKRVNDPSQSDGERALREGEAVNGRTNLDPRVEAFFPEKIYSNGNNDYTFSGDYTVNEAAETTIFQMLANKSRKDENNRETISDRLRPVLFLNAYTEDDDTVRIMGRGGVEVYNGPKDFNLRVDTNGSTATVTVIPEGAPRSEAQTTDFTLSRETSGAADPGDFSNIRYGAYHHDGTDLDVDSTASIEVSNASLKRS